MNPEAHLVETLNRHLVLCREVLEVAEEESQWLRDPSGGARPDLVERKKALLSRLKDSLDTIRQQRLRWQKLNPEERKHGPAVAALLRQNQDLIMKIIVLDRENEQSLLRRGLVPPAHLPSLNRQRPHFVADLYRRSNA